MIYVTPYDPGTLECLGASTDSGFTSMAEAEQLMGEPLRPLVARMLLYPTMGCAITDFALSIDRPAVPAIPCPPPPKRAGHDHA